MPGTTGAPAARAILRAAVFEPILRMAAAGFNIRQGSHPIAPIMLGDAKVATEMARRLLDRGIYVIGFSFPVVPQGQARVRCQLSAAHSRDDLDQAIQAFKTVGTKLGII